MKMSPRITRSAARKPSAVPSETEAVDLSKKYEASGVVGDSQDEGPVGGEEVVVAASDTPSKAARNAAKRKSVDSAKSVIYVEGDEEPVTPYKKRQKLAVQAKETPRSDRKSPKKNSRKVEAAVPAATSADDAAPGDDDGDLAADAEPAAAGEVENEEPETEMTITTTITPVPRGKRTVFGEDDSPGEFYTPLEDPLQASIAKQVASLQEIEEEEDEESDDEAPEAVSTSKPAAQKAMQAAAKAAGR